jgi:uncharacterized integral membrane protein
VGEELNLEMGVILMLWFAAPNPVPLALTWPASTFVLPAVAVAVASALVGVVVFKTFVRKPAYRPALRVVEGGQTELTFKPA